MKPRKNRNPGLKYMLHLLISSLVLALQPVAAVAQSPDPALTRLVAASAQLMRRTAQDREALPFTVSARYDDKVTRSHAGFALENIDFDTFRLAMSQTDFWCSMMILHLNVKGCTYREDGEIRFLDIYLGRKFFQELEAASHIEFRFNDHSSVEVSRIHLTADSGPYGTSRFKYVFEAVEVPEGVYVELRLTNATGALGSLANLYLKTLARSKVGFSRTGTSMTGKPKYVRGQLAAAERNVVRYMLALEVSLTRLNDSFENRAMAWFDATARYARQLYELDRDDYVSMKMREYENQLTAQLSADLESGRKTTQ